MPTKGRTYKGWQFEQDFGKIKPKFLGRIDACIYMVENKTTLREAGKSCNVSHSTLHIFIHKELKWLSHDLFKATIQQIKENSYNRNVKHAQIMRQYRWKNHKKKGE